MKVSNFLPLIGVGIFLYLLLQIDVAQVASLIVQISIPLFALAVGVTFIDIVIKAFKWQVIFNSYNIPVPFTRFLKAWIVGLSLSLITPGKIGDFAKAYYLKDKAPVGKGLTTVMADRVIDLLTLFVLTIIGLSLFATIYSSNAALLISTYILFSAFVLAIFVFSRKSVASFMLRPLYHRTVPEKYKEKMKGVYDDFYSGIAIILARKRVVISVILLTFLVWTGTILSIYLIILSLGITVPLNILFVIFPVITLLEALPISVSGVGTRDAALIFFFGFVAVSAEMSVAVSLIYLLISYIFAGTGFLLWYKEPIKMTP